VTSLRERLLAKAVINWETGCWEWTANTDPRGYGRIKVGGRNGQKAKAYRVSYELAYGPIPEGLTIDHLCRVRHCINPAHLEAVPMVVNTLRGISVPAINARKTHCIRGHEFTPENTYRSTNGRGGTGRGCRACLRKYDAGRVR
jgi:hypothetical protein